MEHLLNIALLVLIQFIFVKGEADLVLEQGCAYDSIRYKCTTTYAFQRWVIKDNHDQELTKINFSSTHRVNQTIYSNPYTFILHGVSALNGQFSSSLYFDYSPAQDNITIICIDGHNGEMTEQIFQLKNIYPHAVNDLAATFLSNTKAEVSWLNDIYFRYQWNLMEDYFEIIAVDNDQTLQKATLYLNNSIVDERITIILSDLFYSSCLNTDCKSEHNQASDHRCEHVIFQVKYYSSHESCTSRPAEITTRPPGDLIKFFTNKTENSIVLKVLQSHCADSTTAVIQARCKTSGTYLPHQNRTAILEPGGEKEVHYSTMQDNHTIVEITVTDERGGAILFTKEFNDTIVVDDIDQFNGSRSCNFSILVGIYSAILLTIFNT